MNSYALIDLHCDTLTDCIYKNSDPDTLDDPGRVLSLSAIPADVHWAQFYAVFIPDEYRGQAAIDYYETNRDNFNRQMKKFCDRVTPCHTASSTETVMHVFIASTGIFVACMFPIHQFLYLFSTPHGLFSIPLRHTRNLSLPKTSSGKCSNRTGCSLLS